MLFQTQWPHPCASCHSVQLAFLKHVIYLFILLINLNLFFIYLCIQLKLQDYWREPEYNYRGCNLALELTLFQKEFQVHGAR